MSQTNWREPLEFTAGDTLAFKRALPDYPATDGWSLIYELRGGSQAIEFTSIADGRDHSVTVTAAVTATWAADTYVLTGYVTDGTARHQIYYGDLIVRLNTQTATGDEDIRTFAQKMVELLETVMLARAGDSLAESQVGETRFKHYTPEQLERAHAYWTSLRRNEIAMDRVKNGGANPYKIVSRFNVMPAGPGPGAYPPINPYREVET